MNCLCTQAKYVYKILTITGHDGIQHDELTRFGMDGWRVAEVLERFTGDSDTAYTRYLLEQAHAKRHAPQESTS